MVEYRIYLFQSRSNTTRYNGKTITRVHKPGNMIMPIDESCPSRQDCYDLGKFSIIIIKNVKNI